MIVLPPFFVHRFFLLTISFSLNFMIPFSFFLFLIVLSGLTASSNFNNSGSGYNVMCMHPQPAYLLFNSSEHNGGRLSKMQYQTNPVGDFAHRPLAGFDGYLRCHVSYSRLSFFTYIFFCRIDGFFPPSFLWMCWLMKTLSVVDCLVPCAVCLRPSTRSHSLMVPGRYTCPAGYETDYSVWSSCQDLNLISAYPHFYEFSSPFFV